MRPVSFLAVVVLALTAGCGASAAGHGPIQFGLTGGNIAPYRVTIQPNGSVRSNGSQHRVRPQIAAARVRQLRREIDRAHLASRRCAGVLPDVASQYIRSGGRTFTVHGSCEAAFQRVWTDLTEAVSRS